MDTEVNRSHSNGSSPSGVCSSQTRMAHTLSGSLPHRFSRARRQHGQRAIGELHDSRASRSSMTARHVKRSAGWSFPSSHLIEQMRVPFRFWRGSLDSQTLAPENGSAWLDRPLQNGNMSAPRSPTWTTVASAGKRALARHLAHPHIRFPFTSLPSAGSASRLSELACATSGFLHRTAHHLAALWQDGQHRRADTALVLAHCRASPKPFVLG